MPDDTAAERLLAKFEIDLQPIKKAFTEIQDLVNKANQALGASTQQTAGATQALRVQLDQIKVAQEQLISAARVSIEQEKLKTQAAKTSVVEIQKQAQEQQAAAKLARIAGEEELKKKAAAAEVVGELKKETAELEKQRKEHQANIAAIQLEMAEVRKKRLEEQHERRESERGGLPGGLRYGLGRALFGQGLAGGVAAGVLAGGGITLLLESAAHAAERFVEKLREITVESGKLTILEHTFQRLATGAGIEAGKAIDNLREKTEGLVGRVQLLRLANVALQSPYKTNIQQVSELAGAIVRLGEATTRATPEQALQRYERALATGRMQMLAYVTGFTVGELRLKSFGRTVDDVSRKQQEFQHIYKILTDRAREVGELPETFEKAIKRLSVSWHDLLESFGKGFNISVGVQIFADLMRQATGHTVLLEHTAERMGQKVGNAFAVIGVGAKTIAPVFTGLLTILKDLVNIGAGLLGIRTRTDDITKSGDEAGKSFAKAHPTFVRIVESVIQINGQLRILINYLDFVLVKIGKVIDLLPKEHRAGEIGAALGVRLGARFGVPGAVAGGFAGFMAGEAVGGQPTEQELEQERRRRAALPWWERGKQSPLYKGVWLGEGKPSTGAPSPGQKAAAQPKQLTDWEKLQENNRKAMADMEEQSKAFLKSADDAQERLKKGFAGLFAREGGDDGGLKRQRAISAARAEHIRAAAKEELEIEKTKIEEDKEANENAYREGLKSLEEYIEKRHELNNRGLQARLKDIDIETQSQLDRLKEQRNTQDLYEEQYQEKVAAVKASANRQRTEAERQFGIQENRTAEDERRARIANQVRQIQDDLQIDEKRAQNRLKAFQRDIQLQEEHITHEERLNEKRLTRGEITPEAYFTRQMELTRDRFDAQIAAANKARDTEISNAQLEIKAAQDVLKTEGETAQHKEEARKKVELATEKEAQARIDWEDKVRKAVVDTEDQITRYLEDQTEKRLRSINDFYGRQQQFLETQIQYQQAQGPGVTFQTPTEDLLRKLSDNLQKQREELIQLANDLAAVGQKGTTEWYRIVDAIEQSYQKQAKFNEELRQMTYIMRPAITLFGQLSQSIGQVFQSKFGQNLASVLGGAVGYLEQLPKIFQQISGKTSAPPKSPAQLALERDAQDLFRAAKTSVDTLKNPVDNTTRAFKELIVAIDAVRKKLPDIGGGTGVPGIPLISGLLNEATAKVLHRRGEEGSGETEYEGGGLPGGDIETGEQGSGEGGIGKLPSTMSKMAKKISEWTEKIAGAVAALSGFIAALGQARSGLAGAVGGGLAGVGLGAQIGNMIAPGIGGAIGAAVGGIGGAITGGLIGSKHRQVEKDITELTNRFKDIMSAFNQNTNNLNLAITRMQDLAQQAREMQSHSKKGHEDYQKQIDQYNDQIQQMELQRVQIIREMNQELAKIRAPYGMQEYLGTLQGIVQQYDKFAGAAKTTEELAAANELLVRSLRDYEYELQQKMAQDEQGAIQDALQLNDLLYQRQQLVRQLSDQIAGVMSQGVLTRQLTMAQTKGAQVYEIQVNAQRQLQQMNEQIAAANYRVSLESKIFGLAQTRIGLEMQLLVLQNRQTDWDMERILALRQFYMELSSGKISGSMAGLLGAIPITTNPIGPIDLAHLFEALAAGAYQDRAQYGYADFRGANLR